MQLHQVALIEQSQLQMALFDECANRHTLERRDPADALGLAPLLDGLAADHAAVPHQHQLCDAEVRRIACRSCSRQDTYVTVDENVAALFCLPLHCTALD